jgi:hypothetical protein
MRAMDFFEDEQVFERFKSPSKYFEKMSSVAFKPVSCMVAIMSLHAIRCNIHEFCCNGLHGVTWLSMIIWFV